VSGLLKSFFRDAPTPLLTFDIGAQLLKASDIQEEDAQIAELKKLLAKLPAVNLEVAKVLELKIPSL
jgi:hypothetical protein